MTDRIVLLENAARTIREMMAVRSLKEVHHRPLSASDGPPMTFQSKHALVVVKWMLPTTKVGVKDIRQLCEEMRKNDIQHVLLVLTNDLTSFAANEISTSSYRIERWLLSALQINPTHFFLTPQHRLLSAKEKKGLKVTVSKLPKMLASDSIARFYGARRGAVFEITRKSPDGFAYLAYRCVA